MSKEYTRSMSILGSLPVAGQIVLFDDFESILNWTKTEGEGDSIHELDPSLSKHGNQCLHLKTRTTGADTGDIIGTKRILHLLPSKVMSFSIAFRTPNHVRIDTILFLFKWKDGSQDYNAQIRFKPNVPSWEYYDSAGQYTLFTGLDEKPAIDTWHFINLKVNFATHHYLSLQYDHLLADLSALAVNLGAGATDTSSSAWIQFQTAGANPAELYLDDALIHEL